MRRRLFTLSWAVSLVLCVAACVLCLAGLFFPVTWRSQSAAGQLVLHLSGPRVLVARFQGSPAQRSPVFGQGGTPSDLTEAVSDDLYGVAEEGRHRAWLGGVESAWGTFPNGYARYWVLPLW